jgi:hypothetical protein
LGSSSNRELNLKRYSVSKNSPLLKYPYSTNPIAVVKFPFPSGRLFLEYPK